MSLFTTAVRNRRCEDCRELFQPTQKQTRNNDRWGDFLCPSCTRRPQRVAARAQRRQRERLDREMKLKPKVLPTQFWNCHYCGDPVPIGPSGLLEAHLDIYPERWCEGGNRLPGDTGTRPGNPKAGAPAYVRRMPMSSQKRHLSRTVKVGETSRGGL